MSFLSVSKFDEFMPGEKELFLVRKHRVVYLVTIMSKMMKYVPIGLVLWAYFYFQKFLTDDLLSDKTYTILKIVFTALFIGSIALMLIKQYIDWYYDNLVITNRRIINANQHFIWGKDIASVYLSDILDIAAQHKGIFSTIFSYGTLKIETSSPVQNDMVLNYVPHHHHVLQIIQSIQSEYKNQKFDVEEIVQHEQQFQKDHPEAKH